jgi:hypothetical protein
VRDDQSHYSQNQVLQILDEGLARWEGMAGTRSRTGNASETHMQGDQLLEQLSIAKKKSEAKSANTADAKRQKGEYYGVLKCVQQGAGPEDRGGGVRCACLG